MAATVPGAEEVTGTSPGDEAIARTPPSAEVLYAGELEIRRGDGLVLAAGQP